jgi:hypothetical protein
LWFRVKDVRFILQGSEGLGTGYGLKSEFRA